METRCRHDYRDYETSPTGPSDADNPAAIHPGLCKLTNEVHPIFRRNNFPGVEYEVLVPVLRLASLLIDTDCLLDFWHAIFFGERCKLHPEGDGIDDDTTYVNFSRRRAQLSARDRAMTRLKLGTLSHMVKFYADPSQEADSAEAWCQDERKLDGCPYDLGNVEGVVDRIMYSEKSYLDLQRLSTEEHPDQDALEWKWLFMAVLLTHELAHGAGFMAFGPDAETIFEGGTIGEIGYEWTDHIFGGLLWPGDASLVEPGSCVVANWPSASIAKLYTHRDYSIWLRGQCPDIDVSWPVSRTFCRKLFDPTFWEDEVPKFGADALKPTKGIAYRCKVDQTGDFTHFRPRPESADFFDGVPDGYYASESGFSPWLHPIASWTDADQEGWGRLMRINVDALYLNGE